MKFLDKLMTPEQQAKMLEKAKSLTKDATSAAKVIGKLAKEEVIDKYATAETKDKVLKSLGELKDKTVETAGSLKNKYETYKKEEDQKQGSSTPKDDDKKGS